MLQIALWALLIVSLVSVVYTLSGATRKNLGHTANSLVIPMIGVVIATIHLV